MAKIEKVAEVSPLMQAVSAYIASALKRKLPQEVAGRAKNHLVDTFAAILSGSKLLPGRRAIAYVKPSRQWSRIFIETARSLRVFAS